MTTTSVLKPLLKRLRLGYLLNTLPERLVLARGEQLHYAAFLLLEENWDGIYGSRGLRERIAAKKLLVVGSGGVEKNIDLILCRRFKSRRISWSRAGAQNLLKLKLLRYDRKDWKAYWQRRLN
jgi:hypothetical protein